MTSLKLTLPILFTALLSACSSTNTETAQVSNENITNDTTTSERAEKCYLVADGANKIQRLKAKLQNKGQDMSQCLDLSLEDEYIIKQKIARMKAPKSLMDEPPEHDLLKK